MIENMITLSVLYRFQKLAFILSFYFQFSVSTFSQFLEFSSNVFLKFWKKKTTEEKAKKL